jgi:hypothetical protein
MHLAEFLALLCAGLFAGAAVYINLAEHPARMGRDTRVALEVWGPSYARATRMQAPLALVALACGAVAWWLGAGVSWLVAGLLIGAVVPFTLAVMMPLNKALLTHGRIASTETRALLTRWGRLHAVRSVLALAAIALMAWRIGA